MCPRTFYAHSRPDPDKDRWQELRKHLDEVATLAEQFAPGEWKTHARVAGLWHDAGKYQLAFQRYIEKDVEASNEGAEGRRIQHAIVGAAHALRKGMDLLPIALAVQAHHGRLKNAGLLEDAVTNVGAALLHDAEHDGLPQDLMEIAVPQLPPKAEDRLYLALATRFLFSALVDADSLNTEEWDKGEARQADFDPITALATHVEAACQEKSSNVLHKADSALNRMRAEVLKQCLASASLPPGSFTLTVPTGGGKTLNPAKPVWFVLDELASLNKLPQLHTVVTQSRKSGNPVVLGFQGRSQLEKRYGKDAEVILSQPATKIFLKTSEAHSAKWVSDAIGEVELERLKESRSAGLIGGRKQYTLEITTQPLVMASEIAGLEPLHGYIKQENYVVRVRFPYVAPIEKQLRFIERTVSISPRSVAVQHAAANAQQASTAPDQPSRKPVQKQSLFSGPARQKAGNEKPRDWDESEWIE
jgi:CRISPR-associated endonuclease Cas3-HD